MYFPDSHSSVRLDPHHIVRTSTLILPSLQCCGRNLGSSHPILPPEEPFLFSILHTILHTAKLLSDKILRHFVSYLDRHIEQLLAVIAISNRLETPHVWIIYSEVQRVILRRLSGV